MEWVDASRTIQKSSGCQANFRSFRYVVAAEPMLVLDN